MRARRRNMQNVINYHIPQMGQVIEVIREDVYYA